MTSVHLQFDRLPGKPIGAVMDLFGKGAGKLASANYLSR